MLPTFLRCIGFKNLGEFEQGKFQRSLYHTTNVIVFSVDAWNLNPYRLALPFVVATIAFSWRIGNSPPPVLCDKSNAGLKTKDNAPFSPVLVPLTDRNCVS